MSTLDEIFTSHPLEAPYRATKKARCISAFSDWVGVGTFNEWHMALDALAGDPPLGFYSSATVADALTFFLEHPSLTWMAISDHSKSLSHAISSTLRPTASWVNQDRLSLDSPDEAADFDSIWHPEYQRYAEHVLNHLMRIPLQVLGTIRGRDYISPALANRASILEANVASSMVSGFDPVIRNAIAHGTAEFEPHRIRYTDRTRVQQLAPWEFAELFDRLVDTCHGLLASIILFAAETRDGPNALILRNLPFGLRRLLVTGLCTHPSLSIRAMLESSSPGTGAQLDVVCQTHNPSRAAHQFDGLFIAWQSSRVYPAYDRILVSIDSGRPSTSLLVVNARNLSTAIEQQQDLASCASGLVQGSLLWYDAPQWRSTLSTFTTLVKWRWPGLVEEMRANAEAAGIVKPICKYKFAAVENNSSRSLPRLACHAVLLEGGPITDAKLVATIRHMIGRLRRRRIRTSDLYGPKGLPRPPSQIAIRLAARPARLRFLKALSWASPELVLIAEWAKKPRVALPFYTKDADFIDRTLRIKYNPSLMSRGNAGPT